VTKIDSSESYPQAVTIDEIESSAPSSALENAVTPDVERRSVDWDVRQGPKNYLTLVAAQIASAALSFIAVWLATRLLGPTGYGGVVAIVAASQAIGQLGVNWTSASLSRYGVQEFVETGRIAKPFWTRFWIFVPNVVLVLATSGLWLPFLSSLLKLPSQAYLLVLAHFLTNAFWIHVQQGLQGAKLLRLQGSLLTFERVLVFLTVLVCYLTHSASFMTVTLAYVLAPFTASVAGLWVLRKLVFPVSWIDRDLLKRMVKFSVPILPASLIGYMSSNYLDAFFISHYLTSAHLGVYNVVYLIAGISLQLPLLIGSVLIPLFITLEVDGSEDRARRFMLNVLPTLTLIWGLACTVMATILVYIFPKIFGAQFSESGPLFWPLMTGAALSGPVLMGYAPYNHSKAVTYIPMVAAIGTAAVNLMLNFLLVPPYGLVGCAWATTIAFAVHPIIVVALVHSRLLHAPTWVLQALIPPLAGAVCAIFYTSLIALGVTFLASGLLMIMHRSSLTTGLRTLKNIQRRQRGLPVET
jgi:O-antigen/teichoic acid export membrane protein